MNNTERVAKYIVEASFETLGNDVVEMTKECLVDWITVTVAGSREAPARFVREGIGVPDVPGGALVVGTGKTTVPMLAALANGTAAHALDFDDAHEMSPGHGGAPVVSAALSASHLVNECSGRDIITAVAAGIHVMYSVNAGFMPEHYDLGWHNTGTMGHFGAAAASAKILGLDESQTAHAIAIAGNQASGVRESFGTMCKPLNAGKAAMGGLMAAQLARSGFTGARDIIGGRSGLLTVMAPEPHSEAIADVLSGANQILGVRFKRYPSCFATHPVIESAAALRRRYSIDPREVESVTCLVYPRAVDVASIQAPSTGLEAKFSCQYCAALGLIRGEIGPRDFDDSRVSDPEVCMLASRVRLVPVESYAATRSATVVVRTTDGAEYRESTNLKEALADPGGQREDVIAKANATLAGTAGRDLTSRILDLLLSLERLPDVSEMVACLGRISLDK